MVPKDATQAPALDRLNKWLEEKGGRRWLAEKLDVSSPTVYRWCTGEHSPDAHYRRAIYDLSKGEVHFDDWYTDEQLRCAYAHSRTLKRRLQRRDAIKRGDL